MHPGKNLNVITGETGAGKSIMLGAIGLLLGSRADSKIVFDENEKCIIEGIFDIKNYDLQPAFEAANIDYSDECIIRREVSDSGKSRAFINDTPVTLDVLKPIASSLIDIHSQHETLLLAHPGFQISVLDAYAENNKLVQEYKKKYKEYKTLEASYRELIHAIGEQKKQFDYHSFLLNELTEAALHEHEQEALEQELNTLNNAEHIKSKISSALCLLSDGEQNVLSSLASAERQIEQVCANSSLFISLKDRLHSTLIELKDIVAEVETLSERIQYDPERALMLQQRLDKIYHLQKKHNVNTISELLQIKDELEAKVEMVVTGENETSQLKEKLNKSYDELLRIANDLSRKRKQSVPDITQELQKLLADVGMPQATINIEVNSSDPGPNGIDHVNFLFSANKGVPPQELRNVASGGEFSRLMLCLKYILAVKTSMPTIIFDEIDTGISGEVAIRVGKMLQEMSARHQVISITHLPQMACLGDTHFFVYKDNSSSRSVSKIKKLNTDERIREIAKMIGGENPSDTVIKNAKEMLRTS